MIWKLSKMTVWIRIDNVRMFVSTLQKYKSPYFYCFAAAVTIVGTVGIVGIGTWSLAWHFFTHLHIHCCSPHSLQHLWGWSSASGDSKGRTQRTETWGHNNYHWTARRAEYSWRNKDTHRTKLTKYRDGPCLWVFIFSNILQDSYAHIKISPIRM